MTEPEKNGIQNQLGQLTESVDWIKRDLANKDKALSGINQKVESLPCERISSRIEQVEEWKKHVEQGNEDKSKRAMSFRDVLTIVLISAVVNGILVPIIYSIVFAAQGG